MSANAPISEPPSPGRREEGSLTLGQEEPSISARSLNRAARGSIVNVAGAGISAFANLALTVVVARVASQIDAGVFFSAISIFLLVDSLGQLGTNAGLVYFLSGARARGELRHSRAVMKTAAIPVLIVAVMMGTLLFLLSNPLGSLLSPGREEQFAHYMRIMAFFLPCAAAMNLALSGSRGLGTMKAYASIDQVSRPLLQLGLVGAALFFAGSQQLAWAWAVAYLPMAVLAWFWWRRLMRGASAGQVRPPTPLRGPFWKFSGPRALAGVTQVAMQRLDIVLVGALAGLPAAAIYTAATRFLVLGQTTARAVSMSIQPLLGEALARDDRGDAKSLYQASTAWLVLATWPIYLMLIGFGPTILGVFGEGYESGRDALLILCAVMLIATACGMVDMVLMMAGRSLWNLMNVLIAFAVNLSVDLVLIPQVGFIGAAIGWAGGILVANLLPLSQVRFSLGLHPFGKATMTAMASAALCFGAVPTIATSILGQGLLTLGLGGAVGMAIYLAAIYWRRRSLQIAVLLKAVRRRREKRVAG